MDEPTTIETEKRGLSQKLRRVRRKEQLGAPGDGALSPPPKQPYHKRVNAWSDTSRSAANASAMIYLQNIQQLDGDHAERRKKQLEEQRALWESTLPEALVDHIGYFSSGHDLDHICPDETP